MQSVAAYCLYYLARDDHDKYYDIGLLSAILGLALLSLLSYITHKTRHVDLEISDRLANIRLIVQFASGFLVVFVVRIITNTEYNMMLGAMLANMYWVVVGMVYQLDTFTAVWLHIYFDANEKWLSESQL
eukprot:Awhi_evm1s187